MRPARLALVALLDSAEIEESLERAVSLFSHGPAWEVLEVAVRMRATDGGRFDEAIGGRAALALSEMEPWAKSEIARCQRYVTIEATAPESLAQPLIQSADALLFALAEAGELTRALDRSTFVWRTPPELLQRRPERPFLADEHFVVVVEAVERAPGVGHLVRTRGLGKFARAEVGMRTPRAHAERVAEMVREVARRGAAGEPFLPGRRLQIPSLPPLALYPRSEDCLQPLPPDQAPLFELREGGLSLVR